MHIYRKFVLFQLKVSRHFDDHQAIYRLLPWLMSTKALLIMKYFKIQSFLETEQDVDIQVLLLFGQKH